ncbi:MAG: hypothetical protein ACP6IS_00420 [Candidatus Asgardarchaeia archaeon]
MQVETIVALNLLFLIAPLIILNLLPPNDKKGGRVYIHMLESLSFSLIIGGVLFPISLLVLYALLHVKLLLIFQNLRWRVYLSLFIFTLFLIRDLVVKKYGKKINLGQ